MMVALQRAIRATFDKGRWEELGYLLGRSNAILEHDRLLRSLSWGDDDYGQCIFQVLRELLGDGWESLDQIEDYVDLPTWLKKKEPELYEQLYESGQPASTLPLEEVEAAAGIHDVGELNKHAARIRLGIRDDPAQAIGSAKELLESVLKTIIGDDSLKSDADINGLLKQVRGVLNLDPKSVTGAAPVAETLKRTLSSLGQIVIGVAEVRNLCGTGHGRSQSYDLEIAHARLVVNSAIAIATFLLEVWTDERTRIA